MTYQEWDSNITTMVNMMTKNFTMSDLEIELLLDMVYREIINETHLTFVYELVYPADTVIETTSNSKQHYRIYDINNCALGHWPLCYATSEKMEVVEVLTTDGYNIRKFMDMVKPGLWVKNDQGVLYSEYDDSFQEVNLVFVQKCIPLITECEEWVYEATYKAMISGIQYQVQNIIPSQIDAQIDNTLYLRFQNDKEAIINKYPVAQSSGRRKLPWTNIVEELNYDKDECNTDPDCSNGEDCETYPCQRFIVDGEPFNTFDGVNFYVSCVHGSCGDIDNPDVPGDIDFGLNCYDLPCPPCVDFYVYDSNLHEMVRFTTADIDNGALTSPFVVSLTHESCALLPGSDAPIPGSEGLDCYDVEPCPDCAGLSVWNPLTSVYDPYNILDDVTGLNERFVVSSLVNGGCGTIEESTLPTISVLTASTDGEGVVNLTWTASTGDPSPLYNVFRDGSQIIGGLNSLDYQDVVADGTYVYTVVAYNSAGSTTSLPVSGTSLVIPTGVLPVKITNFEATNDIPDLVAMYFTQPLGGDLPVQHDLWRRDGATWVLAVSDITSGYTYTGTGFDELTMYKIVATNAAGSIDSNLNEGLALITGGSYFNVSSTGGYLRLVTDGEPYAILG